MANFVTFDDLRRLAPPLQEAEQLRKFATANTGKNVFLSYSRADSEFLPTIIMILKNHGATVYVDFSDHRIPSEVSAATAAILRDSMRKCSRLVLFVTTRSKDSRWIPWELGLGDGFHNQENVALFPAADLATEITWAEREYLGLYRRIVWGRIAGDHEDSWIVLNHLDNTALPLRRWLLGN